MPEAIVALGETKRIVGRLRFESEGRRQHSQIEYNEDWLGWENAFALSPGLPLRAGGHFASGGREDKRDALHGCFADAAPDSWGREEPYSKDGAPDLSASSTNTSSRLGRTVGIMI